MEFTLQGMWAEMGLLAKGVALFLVIMSLWSVYVMIERMITFNTGAKQSYRFVLELREHMEKRDIDGAIAASKRYSKSPLARIMYSGLTEYKAGLEAKTHGGPDDIGQFDLVDAVNRAMERTKERETVNLRKRLGGLATIASAAPFVGLFGTVVGIINAFGKLQGGGGIDVVGPGIAEALVVTAVGLFVAIPAAMMFNYFTGRVEFFVVDMNDVASEMVDHVLKEGRVRA